MCGSFVPDPHFTLRGIRFFREVLNEFRALTHA